jgi:hypothetical protein
MARARVAIDTFTIPEGRRRRVYRPAGNFAIRQGRVNPDARALRPAQAGVPLSLALAQAEIVKLN